MIYDNINNIDRYNLPQVEFEEIKEFVLNDVVTKFQSGKFSIKSNLESFGIGLSYATKAAEECLWEAHRRYIDIHVLLEGEELVYINEIEDMEVTKSYDSENDYLLLDGKERKSLLLKANQFLILYPNEVHKTSVLVDDVSNVKKIVFKLPL